MSKVELISVETDTKKVYKVSDNFVFTFTLNCTDDIPDDIEFEIVYFGDAYSDQHDQKIGFNAVGPLQKGKQFFQLESTPIDLTKIPIKTLFGLTTILIVAKYRGQQFLRVGYVVNVSYPGIRAEELVDSDDIPIGQNLEEDGEEDLEIMDDDEIDEDNEDDEEEDDSEDNEDDSEDNEEEEDLIDDEEALNEEELHIHGGIQDVLASCFKPNSNCAPIPLETPISNDKDDFEYKEKQLKKSCIEMSLHESPIIHVFEIDWDDNQNDDDNVVESSENVDNSPVKEKEGGDSDQIVKKAKCD